MNGQHAQVKTVFILGDDPYYQKFIHAKAEIGDWISLMEGDWMQSPWNGTYDEFSPGDSSFWDWKISHETDGEGVFWLSDSYGELYAIALPRDKALLVYGLQLLNKDEKIQSTWE